MLRDDIGNGALRIYQFKALELRLVRKLLTVVSRWHVGPVIGDSQGKIWKPE